MRNAIHFALGALVLAAGARGQQAQSQQPQAQQPPAQSVSRAAPTTTEPFEIYQIDLNPTGTGFALTKPIDEGDVYVFKAWPDRATVRLQKTRVKKMIRRTKDINDNVLYQIDLVPSGQMIARDNPTLTGTIYEFHSWLEGTFMSVRQADVQKITRLTGLAAFKVHMQQLGATEIGNLAMQGGGTVTVLPDPSAARSQPSAAPGQSSAPPGASAYQEPGNWIYQGVPGVTDAWAPASAVVNSPGGLPRAPDRKPNN